LFAITCEMITQVMYTVINIFYRVADEFQQLSDNARHNVEGYLGHPVNQYRLVQRLVSEWSNVEELVMEDVTDGKVLLRLLG